MAPTAGTAPAITLIAVRLDIDMGISLLYSFSGSAFVSGARSALD
jgi:hypothetical protein